MPTYGLLMKYTDQGIKNIKDSPRRLAEGAKAYEAMGGKVLGYWATMGEYDILAIGEIPNDEAASAFALALSAQGNVRTTSFRMFTPEEFEKSVKMLP
ncbi:MAG: GYD domain-containing protein [bacterium]